MTRSLRIPALLLPLLLAAACDSGPPSQPAPAPDKAPAAKQAAAKADEGAAEKAPTPEPASPAADAAEATAPTPAEDAAAPAPADAPTPAEDAAAAPEAAAEPAPEPKAEVTDVRDPSLVPAGTPAANLAAFKRLPVAKGDKAPIGGVGENGIHLDELEIGRGWHKSRCDLVGSDFTVGVDDRVNVCMRVIHPRNAEDVLVVSWERDGKRNQRNKVKVSSIHAYLTRVWLPITDARKGKWKARIETEKDTELGAVDFTIQ